MLALSAHAQSSIHGIVRDRVTNSILDSVRVRNIHNSQSIRLDSSGGFMLEVKSGHLLEFRRKDYEVLRIRIVNEKQPSYYVLHMERSQPLLDVNGHLLPYQVDSLALDQIYGIFIRGEHKGDIDMRSLPLAALSKRNREIWAFQEMYAKWQSEKYIDFVFNKELVKKITHLSGNDLRRFMRLYRPSVSFLRNATEYEYLDYIKKSYRDFQRKGKY